MNYHPFKTNARSVQAIKNKKNENTLDLDTKSFVNDVSSLEKSIKNTTGYNRFKPINQPLSSFESKKSRNSTSSDQNLKLTFISGQTIDQT